MLTSCLFTVRVCCEGLLDVLMPSIPLRNKNVEDFGWVGLLCSVGSCWLEGLEESLAPSRVVCSCGRDIFAHHSPESWWSASSADAQQCHSSGDRVHGDRRVPACHGSCWCCHRLAAASPACLRKAVSLLCELSMDLMLPIMFPIIANRYSVLWYIPAVYTGLGNT